MAELPDSVIKHLSQSDKAQYNRVMKGCARWLPCGLGG